MVLHGINPGLENLQMRLIEVAWLHVHEVVTP